MESRISRRGLLKMIGAGAVGGFGSGSRVLKNAKEGLPKEYSFLRFYDDYIGRVVDYFNEKHGQRLDSDLDRAKIIVESGDVRFRGGDVRDDAFRYDPAQIANEGDCALDILVNGEEYTGLIGDFSSLKGIRHTPWNKKLGAWDYSNSNITWKHSIYGGMGWLFHKAAKRGDRIFERGGIREYKVKSGDNLWNIAKKEGTVSEIITKYTKRINPKFVPDKINIGDILRFRAAEKRVVIIGWDSWGRAVKEYNGGEDPNYFRKVMGVYNNIKNWRKS